MRAILFAAISVAAGCTCRTASIADSGSSWLEADALFHQESRWLGGDAALSIDLGNDRSLWLFGDSFVATSANNVRTESTYARNSVAVMTGRNPTTASMQFAWTFAVDGGMPSAFFPAPSDDSWHWPEQGVRFDGGPLLVFLAITKATPNQGLGFTEAGFDAVLILNPDDPPTQWQQQLLTPALPSWDSSVSVGLAVNVVDGFVTGLAAGNHSAHSAWLVRWPLSEATAGDLTHPTWWNGAAGWVAQDELSAAPVEILPSAAPECSLQLDAARNKWVYVQSRGFGATTIAVRTADVITGPYSDPADVFTPPESAGPNPFVYAGKGHPELAPRTPGRLVVTYATNSMTFSDLFTADGIAHLYWPRFVEISY